MQSSEMAKTNRRLLSLRFFLAFLSISFAAGFQSDELMQDDEEFGLEGGRPAADPQLYIPTQTPVRRRPELDLLAGSSDSKSIQFSLEHELGTPGFSPAGTFTARLKSWSHGGQTLTKLRFSRNALTEEEKKAFKKLLKEDGYYTIRVPSNVLDPPGRDFVVSSVRARCIPREILDEHFIIHADGVNILAVNYGSAEACQYPRLLRYPAKWSFTSYTVMKTSEQAPRTPTFAEKLLAVEEGVGEGVKPPEKTFWAKYWMYLVPLVFIVLNAMTQAMNMPPEEGAAGQAAQLAPSANVRRR
ncbi:ER membrane protein complex subunit 10-like [Zingiber officinale]|uniref:ER membrane protein complex subunit 10-like n=1 Tax=Zingiber officinale TaxID=94328 RepID=UPI001C4A981E|nr:ER membrane protein complex subunit 10-like [Zingiber officinale]XP_042379281.1 ER membrane protein complex subunit 10-like [Zingiber officinale]